MSGHGWATGGILAWWPLCQGEPAPGAARGFPSWLWGAGNKQPPPLQRQQPPVIKPSGKGCHGTTSEETMLHLHCCSTAPGRCELLRLGCRGVLGGTPSSLLLPLSPPHICRGAAVWGWGSGAVALGPCPASSLGSWGCSLRAPQTFFRVLIPTQRPVPWGRVPISVGPPQAALGTVQVALGGSPRG